MSKQKAIWMSEPLERLKERVDQHNIGKKSGRSGGFSRALAEIVGRYDLLVELCDIELNETELQILYGVFDGNAYLSGGSASMAKSIIKHLDYSILDTSVATPQDREAFAKKVSLLTYADRIALIAKVGL